MNLDFLREAIRLYLEKMEENEGGPFGAIVVRNGEIFGRGWNRVTSTNDPTAHAEDVAIRDTCSHLKTFVLTGCELYSSCEPCPLCLAAIYWSSLDRIYFAATCEDAAVAGFDDRSPYQEINKPRVERTIPMEQALRDEALLALALQRGMVTKSCCNHVCDRLHEPTQRTRIGVIERPSVTTHGFPGIGRHTQTKRIPSAGLPEVDFSHKPLFRNRL